MIGTIAGNMSYLGWLMSLKGIVGRGIVSPEQILRWPETGEHQYPARRKNLGKEFGRFGQEISEVVQSSHVARSANTLSVQCLVEIGN